MVCPACKRILYRVWKNSDQQTIFRPQRSFLWTSHREQNWPCVKKPRGRPSNQAIKQSAAKAG